MTLKKLTIAAVVLGLVNIAPGMLKRASAAARHPVHLMVLSFDPQKGTDDGQNHQGEPQELDKEAENEVDDKDMENDEKDDVDLQERENDKDEHGVQNQAGHHDETDVDDKDAGEDRDEDRDDDMQQERDTDIPPR